MDVLVNVFFLLYTSDYLKANNFRDYVCENMGLYDPILKISWVVSFKKR